MTDDIVDRLRDLQHRFDLPMDELQYGKAWTTIKEAADEIEELRTSIPQLIRNERERCAKIADDNNNSGEGGIIAAVIRGRW